MMLLPCPSCGIRNVGEFRYVGEAKSRPDPESATPDQWRRYLYFQQNSLGWMKETWYHGSGCRRYFAIERHTGSNEVRVLGGQS
jgi:sarcosine oxidase subunit delta